MNSISELKKKSSLKTITEKLDRADSSAKKEDDRFWSPTVDKNGNGRATIRFLPPSPGEDEPFVKVYSHGFQGPTGLWYIENSLTTIGKDDPVSQLNAKLWNSGIEENKETARKQKRRLAFISNVLVLDDPDNPSNNGKVFLYRYGKTVFDMIKEAAGPGFDDMEPMNIFDPWEGANFRVAIRTADGYRKYDRSKFLTPSVLGEDDEIEAIWNQEHSLQAFLKEDNFKTYEELQAKLNRVLNVEVKQPTATSSSSDLNKVLESSSDDSNEDEDLPWNSSNDSSDDLDDIFAKL